MRFRFDQEGTRPGTGKVLLDGYDASSAVSGFTVSADVRDVTTVKLDLVVLHGAGLDLDAEVLIPAPVAALLVEFGWTPPEGAEVRGGAMRLVRKEEPQPTLLDQLPKEEPEVPCSCLAPDAWDPPCPLHGDMADRKKCVCATDPDAPESCYVHGRVGGPS